MHDLKCSRQVDDIPPRALDRLWVPGFPYALRFLFATRPAVMGRVPGIVYRTLATHQTRKAVYTGRYGDAHTALWQRSI